MLIGISRILFLLRKPAQIQRQKRVRGLKEDSQKTKLPQVSSISFLYFPIHQGPQRFSLGRDGTLSERRWPNECQVPINSANLLHSPLLDTGSRAATKLALHVSLASRCSVGSSQRQL